LLLGLFLGVVFIWTFNAFRESDSFYHLKTGQVIWETGVVPTRDIFSYTAPGAPWVTHEWLAEAILYGIFALAGYWGVMAFVACLGGATYLLLYLFVRRRGAGQIVSVMTLLILGSLTFKLWIPRPQTFGFLGLAGLLYLLERYRTTAERRYLWFAVLVIWFWANMHASFVLGLGVILWSFLSELWKRRSVDRPLLWAFFAAGLLAFVNPNGASVYTYLLAIQPTAAALSVAEWKPIQAFLDQPDSLLLILEIIFCSFIVIRQALRRGKDIDLTMAGLFLGAAAAPFVSIRYIGYWPMLASGAFALAVSDLLSERRKKFRPDVLVALAGAVLLLAAVARYPSFPRDYYVDYAVPVRAVDFIEGTSLRGPFFNLYNSGGYLIWRLWPSEKVFIDGRSEVYAGRPVEELLDIVGDLPGGVELRDEKYHVNAMILQYYPLSLVDSILPLVRRLKADGWPLVYWDDAALIFVRAVPENQTVIERYGLFHVSPFRPPDTIPIEERPAAAVELRSLMERVPGSAMVAAYAKEFMRVVQ